MEDRNWRFGVAANIAEVHIGENGEIYCGTKPFTAGTKVYLAGKNWDADCEDICVIGRNRFGRTVLENISVECLKNIRTQRIFRPQVLEIIDYLEVFDGWIWWKRTSEDRKETKLFVEEWKNRQEK